MRSFKWPIYIVLVLLLFVSVSPLVIEWYLIKCLKDDGYQVKLNQFGINYFTGRVSVSNMELTASNGQRFNIFDGSLNFAIIDSFSGLISLDSVNINGSLVDVESEGGKLLIGGIELDSLTEKLRSKRQFSITKLEINNAEVCETRMLQCLNIESVNTSGATGNLNSSGWQFQHSAPLVMNKAFLRDLSREIATFYIGRLEIDQGEYSDQALRLGESLLSNFQLIQSLELSGKRTIARAQTQLGELKVSRLNAEYGERKALHFGEVELISPRQSFSKQLGVSKAPFGSQAFIARLGEQLWLAILGQGGFDFSIEKLRVQGGTVLMKDLLSAPNAVESVTAIRLSSEGIDSRKPSDVSALTLNAKLGEVGQIELTGEGYPLGPKPIFKGSIKIQDWNLANIAAYTPQLFSENISAGVVDVAANFTYKNSNLDLDSQWQLSDLKFDMDSKRSLMSKSFNVLKDHNKSVLVRLKSSGLFPTESNNLSTLMGDKLATSMYRDSTGQLGAANAELGNKGLILGQSKRNAGFSYKPMVFTPNNPMPEIEDQRVLWDIAELLKKKLHMKVQFCSVTTAGEWAEVFNNGIRPGEGFELNQQEQATLNDLALARGKNLKQELIDQGVASAQIKACEPRIDLNNASAPFVSITMQ